MGIYDKIIKQNMEALKKKYRIKKRYLRNCEELRKINDVSVFRYKQRKRKKN